MTIAGLMLFFYAPSLCRNVFFHYTTGVAAGVFLSLVLFSYLIQRKVKPTDYNNKFICIKASNQMCIIHQIIQFLCSSILVAGHWRPILYQCIFWHRFGTMWRHIWFKTMYTYLDIWWLQEQSALLLAIGW